MLRASFVRFVYNLLIRVVCRIGTNVLDAAVSLYVILSMPKRSISGGNAESIARNNVVTRKDTMCVIMIKLPYNYEFTDNIRDTGSSGIIRTGNNW